jgi:hypothetical protein
MIITHNEEALGNAHYKKEFSVTLGRHLTLFSYRPCSGVLLTILILPCLRLYECVPTHVSNSRKRLFY